MTWTYGGDPAANDRDAVRFEVQDTDRAAQMISDEEIAYALGQEGSVLAAAARCCEALARRYAARVDTTVQAADSAVKRTYSTMAKNFAERASELRARAQASNGAPWFGGGSKADKSARATDTDRVQPAFERGQFDGPGGAA